MENYAKYRGAFNADLLILFAVVEKFDYTQQKVQICVEKQYGRERRTDEGSVLEAEINKADEPFQEAITVINK